MKKYRKLLACAMAFLMFCGCKTADITIDDLRPTPQATETPAPTEVPTPSPSPTAEPTPTPTPTPSAEEILLSELTLEEKVAQMFFVRCPDVGAVEMIRDLQPGGLLLFARDFRDLTYQEVEEKLAEYQAVSDIGMLMGTDEEGGTVVRVSSNPNLANAQFESPRDLYLNGGLELVCSTESRKCELLKGLGINVNFAPVCDICDDPNGFMYYRALGLDAVQTAEAVGEIVGAYNASGVGCVLKHFPGYGNAADTHTGIVHDLRGVEEFRSSDFLPFAAGIEAGADCVLVSHSIVECIDAEKPASLSQAWNTVLRDELGFDGVIITDDLSMGAITQYADNTYAAVSAVLAGNDMLCCTDYDVQYPAVLDAVNNGTIEETRIDESVLRILRWKSKLGLI